MKKSTVGGHTICVSWEWWLDDRTALLEWRQPVQNRRLAVIVTTDLSVDHVELQSLLDVDKIVVGIESFMDGRFFGLARLLRQKFRFGGEIAARGDYLPDQINFMKCCGFDCFENDDQQSAAPHEFYSAFYQPSYEGEAGATSIRNTRMKQTS